MLRMFAWAGLGTFVGFLVFAALFFVAVPRHEPDRGVFMVLSLMAALPLGVFAAMFAAISVIKSELDEIRREIMRLQTIEDLVSERAPRSTHVQSGLPRHLPD